MNKTDRMKTLVFIQNIRQKFSKLKFFDDLTEEQKDRLAVNYAQFYITKKRKMTEDEFVQIKKEVQK